MALHWSLVQHFQLYLIRRLGLAQGDDAEAIGTSSSNNNNTRNSCCLMVQRKNKHIVLYEHTNMMVLYINFEYCFCVH